MKVRAAVEDLKGLPHDCILELASSIRRIPNLKTLPVVALSMALTPAGQKEVKQAGISHIISKPLRYATLAAVLLDAVGVPTRAPMKRPNANVDVLSGRKLLVVDDNMVNRRVASSMLSRYEWSNCYKCKWGYGGSLCREKPKERRGIVMILMDIQMPEECDIRERWGMDGGNYTADTRLELENCTLCRNTGDEFCPHQRLPVVAVTADVVVKTRSMCFSSGMDDYVTKPLDQKQLHALLERLISEEKVGECAFSN